MSKKGKKNDKNKEDESEDVSKSMLSCKKISDLDLQVKKQYEYWLETFHYELSMILNSVFYRVCNMDLENNFHRSLLIESIYIHTGIIFEYVKEKAYYTSFGSCKEEEYKDMRKILECNIDVKKATENRNHRVAHKGNRPFSKQEKTSYLEARELGKQVLANFCECYAKYTRNFNYEGLQTLCNWFKQLSEHDTESTSPYLIDSSGCKLGLAAKAETTSVSQCSNAATDISGCTVPYGFDSFSINGTAGARETHNVVLGSCNSSDMKASVAHVPDTEYPVYVDVAAGEVFNVKENF